MWRGEDFVENKRAGHPAWGFSRESTIRIAPGFARLTSLNYTSAQVKQWETWWGA